MVGPQKTKRLCELERALVELKTRERKVNEDRINHLKAKTDQATKELIHLKTGFDQDILKRDILQQRILEMQSEAQFYKNSMNPNVTESMIKSKLNCDKLQVLLAEKIQELEDLKTSLAFYKFEPTNEALKLKIQELEKSRISLSELTFVESSSSSP